MKHDMIGTLTFAEMPKGYEGLVRMFAPRPLHDAADLANATEITDAMAGHDLNGDQEDYFALLGTLINAYEEEHRPRPRRRHDPVGNLTFLMEQHGMSASDVGRLLGQRELGSKLLRKERQMSKAMIARLAEHFHVSPAYFL